MKLRMEIGNMSKRQREYVKETTTRPKSRQQPKATNGSSMQPDNPTLGGRPQLAPK